MNLKWVNNCFPSQFPVFSCQCLFSGNISTTSNLRAVTFLFFAQSVPQHATMNRGWDELWSVLDGLINSWANPECTAWSSSSSFLLTLSQLVVCWQLLYYRYYFYYELMIFTARDTGKLKQDKPVLWLNHRLTDKKRGKLL